MFQQQMSAGVITITGLLMLGVNIDGNAGALLGIIKGSILVGLGLAMAHISSRMVETNHPRTWS